MSSRMRLRVNTNITHLLGQSARIKLRDEATLFLLSNTHITYCADIDYTIVCRAYVVE